eukprot:jgi/Hompol1/6876/HPOL_002991-RA
MLGPVREQPADQQRILVIGAGCSGLVALKECIAEGLTNAVCFEMGSSLGGLWKFTEVEHSKEVHSSVYRNTIIDTSKQMMAFSDFPIPKTWPAFLHHSAIVRYFHMYAEHFDLLPRIQFNTKVLSVRAVPARSGVTSTGSESGQNVGCSDREQWEVVHSTLGKTTVSLFDKVIVATGHHSRPRIPEFKGIDEFKGQVLHSHFYREAMPFKDKRCLVIGLGNSAVDVAVELSYVARQVHVSTRSGAWIMPRFASRGTPIDHRTTRFYALFPLFMRQRALKKLIFNTFGDIISLGFRPQHKPFCAHPTINSELPGRVGAGAVVIKGDVRRFFHATDGTQYVEFEDGSTAHVDVVVMCTGYEIGFPFLEDAASIAGLHVPGSNQVDLYKYVWPIHRDNIAFVGLFQPLGAIMPGSELQSRWIARVWSNKAPALPSADARRADVVAKRDANIKRYGKSPRHTIQVDAGPYFDEIASQIGVVPYLLLLLFIDFTLFIKIVFGCWCPFQYRLHGPGAWKGARQAIMDANAPTDYRNWNGLEAELKSANADQTKAKQA